MPRNQQQPTDDAEDA